MTHNTADNHETQPKENNAERAKNIQSLMLPISIVLAGLFLGGGILGAALISGGQSGNADNNQQVDATEELTELAVEVGVNKREFGSCLSENTYAEKVQNDSAEVSQEGTPHSVLMYGDTRVAFSGALPVDMVTSLIDPLAAGDTQALQVAADEINEGAPRDLVVINESEDVRPVSDEDHIRGPRNADMFLVEYSDMQCPFCQRFHGTAQTLVDQYNTSSSNVSLGWVYRHHPLTQIHPHAATMAVASECVAEQQDNDGFWDYVDSVFQNQSRFSDAR